METSEALHRIFVRHIGILVLCTFIGLGASVAVAATAEPVYEATARVALGGWDPNDASKAKMLADSARALASSDRVVRQAIQTAGVERGISEVSSTVSLRAAGSSSVVDVSVSDRDPEIAAKLANELSAALIDVRWTLLRGGVNEQVADLDARIAAATQQISILEGEARKAPPRTQQAEVANQRYNTAIRERNELVIERRQLVQIGAAQPRAAIIDKAMPPVSASSTGGTLVMVLGGIAGLLAGLVIAATREILTPTVSGPDAVSRAAGGPWLGTVNGGDLFGEDAETESAATAIRLAAASAWAGNVLVIPVGGTNDEADAIASRLSPDGTVANAYAFAGGKHVMVDPERARRGGIVVVAPYSLPRRELNAIEHRAAATGWPVLGVVLVRKPARRTSKDDVLIPIPDEPLDAAIFDADPEHQAVGANGYGTTGSSDGPRDGHTYQA